MKATCNYSYGSVMIIDDNDIDRYIAKRVITVRNFSDEVISYNNAIEALKYLIANQDNTDALPEVIFVDIYMPEMSGFEFMEAYEGLSPTLKKHCSVYIVSSTIDPEDLKRAEGDPNVITFRVKPIDDKFLSEIGKKAC